MPPIEKSAPSHPNISPSPQEICNPINIPNKSTPIYTTLPLLLLTPSSYSPPPPHHPLLPIIPSSPSSPPPPPPERKPTWINFGNINVNVITGKKKKSHKFNRLEIEVFLLPNISPPIPEYRSIKFVLYPYIRTGCINGILRYHVI